MRRDTVARRGTGTIRKWSQSPASATLPCHNRRLPCGKNASLTIMRCSSSHPPPRQELRGPQSLIILSRPGQPKIPVPAIQMLVDSNEHSPYDFRRLVRIAGTIRQTLPAGDYAIAEAPGLFCVERQLVADLY